MALPTLPRKEPKTISVTVRLSTTAATQLRSLAKDHGLSQADVIEHLVKNEFKSYSETRKKNKT